MEPDAGPAKAHASMDRPANLPTESWCSAIAIVLDNKLPARLHICSGSSGSLPYTKPTLYAKPALSTIFLESCVGNVPYQKIMLVLCALTVLGMDFFQ
jgi:hypothetical protein